MPTDEEIERVARAMEDADTVDSRGDPYTAEPNYRDLARAAIAALRRDTEPTEAMVEAGLEVLREPLKERPGHDRGRVKRIYTAMRKAANV